MLTKKDAQPKNWELCFIQQKLFRTLSLGHSIKDNAQKTILKRQGEKPGYIKVFATKYQVIRISRIQFSSVTQSCPTLCDPMNHSTPGLPIQHQLPGFTQTPVHWVGDAIQPSHPLSSPSHALNLLQDQGLFKWVSSSHQLAKVLEFQFQHLSFQWTPRTDLL